MREAGKLAYAELSKAELASYSNDKELHIKTAHVLALLAIAEELARANDREFAKVIVYNK